ncbi:MAG: hypothetical protein P8H62_11935, partial [Henriciella sp.]|nr:hypothetical protein [Henriciella sp.]
QRQQRQDMSNAPPQAHPNWMLTATPKGWHYNSHPIWMRLSSVRGSLCRDTCGWSDNRPCLKLVPL